MSLFWKASSKLAFMMCAHLENKNIFFIDYTNFLLQNIKICQIILLHSIIVCIYIYVCVYTYMYDIAVLIIICHFESTLLLKYSNPCQNWTFQRFARAAYKKGRNGTNENLTLARTRTQVPGFSSADALATKLRVPVTEPEFLS